MDLDAVRMGQGNNDKIFLSLMNDANVALIVFATFAKQFLKIRMTSSDFNLLFVQNSPIFLVSFSAHSETAGTKSGPIFYTSPLNEPQTFEKKPINSQ